LTERRTDGADCFFYEKEGRPKIDLKRDTGWNPDFGYPTPDSIGSIAIEDQSSGDEDSGGD
jgi:hypothetical protein